MQLVATDEFPLADLLSELSKNLREANRRAVVDAKRGKQPLVRVEAAEVELGVTWERTATGGIDIKVVKLGGDVGRSDIQTLTVRLVPASSQPDRDPAHEHVPDLIVGHRDDQVG
jgi:hypothetical protein